MLLICSYKAPHACVFSISMILFTSSPTGLRSPESCDINLCWQFLFCGAFFQIDFVGEAALWIDNSAWVWQLRGQTQAWYTQTLSIYIFFSCCHTAVSHPAELSINSLLIKNLFRYLRLLFFSPSLLIVEAVCKSLEEREDGEREGKERLRRKEVRGKKGKRKGLTFRSGRKKMK